MSRLALAAEQLISLRQQLLEQRQESCAILLGRSVEIDGQLARIVVRESVIPQKSAYSDRSPVSAQLRPEFVGEIAQRARRAGQSVVFVHTHPAGPAQFSKIDDRGELELRPFLERRIPHAHHAALLISPRSMVAREIGTNSSLRVVGAGGRIIWGETAGIDTSPRFDRQIRVFGSDAQGRLETIRVGIVGLGGTGSLVLQQLAHLGIRDLVLIDADVVEESNLNRVVGTTRSDLGKPKVDVAAELAARINPDIRVEARRESVLQARTARSLAATDFVFNCTDSHGSRAVINQVAYQYLVPTIDMGVAITVSEAKISHITGRVQLLAPGVACMTCANLLNSEEIRRDLMTEFERQKDPYISGGVEPAPAVISLNSTVASLAITMFLNTTVNVPGAARFLNYDAINGVVRPAVCPAHPSCIVCSHRGALARADEWPLSARAD
jgi:molybdopterin/thiamine biosynthesis adenylyltransferase/proteasome lid subunit RPN8/RPN11